MKLDTLLNMLSVYVKCLESISEDYKDENIMRFLTYNITEFMFNSLPLKSIEYVFDNESDIESLYNLYNQILFIIEFMNENKDFISYDKIMEVLYKMLENLSTKKNMKYIDEIFLETNFNVENFLNVEKSVIKEDGSFIREKLSILEEEYKCKDTESIINDTSLVIENENLVNFFNIS